MSTKKQKEYEVEDIVDYDGTLYTVKWKGYKKTTKEPIENLENCMELVRRYHVRREETIRNDQINMRVKYFGYNYGKGLVLINTDKGIIGRTFREAINTNTTSIAEFLEGKLMDAFNKI